MSRIAMLLALILLAACRDADTGPKAGGEGIAATVIPCDEQFIPEPGCQDPGPPVGGGINPNDTYVSANVVQSYSTSIIDEATGVVNTSQSVPSAFVLEAGYSPSSGLDVVQHVYLDEADDDHLRVVRIEGNTAVELGFDGAPVAAAPGDLDGEMLNPLADLADLGSFPSVIDAITSGQTGAFKISAIADQLAGVSARVVEIRPGMTARLSDENHLSFSLGLLRGTGGSMEVSFDREKKGGVWVMRRLDQLSNVSEGGKRSEIRSRMEIRGLRIARNVGADRVRDAKRAKRFESLRDVTAVPPSAGASRTASGVNLTVLPPDSWSSTGIIHWNPPVTLPYPVVPPTLPAPGLDPNFDKTEEEKQGCVDAAFAASSFRDFSPGSPRIVFQHGFGSGSCTWKYQVPFFESFATGGRVLGKTNPIMVYEQQAADLVQQIPDQTAGWVFVGHSNGGIISRYIAQTKPSGFAKAVITVNSPHGGARVVTKVGEALDLLQWMAPATGLMYATRSNGSLSAAALLSPNSILRQVFNGGVVVQQMVPGSAFLSALASRPENHFRRYAIRSQAADQWQSVRVFCDLRASTSPGVPAGRRCVEDTKRFVKRALKKSVISSLLAFATSLVPVVNIFSGGFAYVAKAQFTVVAIMWSVDYVWRWAFSDNQPSDGVVPMSSQLWPGADAERVIPAADSHVGSTKSEYVRARLAVLLPFASAE